MKINVLGNFFPDKIFNLNEIKYLNNFNLNNLKIKNLHNEMDKVWNEIFSSNQTKNFSQKLSCFYSHPVWLLNTFFTKNDKESVSHRYSISLYIKKINARKVLDYGGGGGSLAEIINKSSGNIKIDIYEPYSSKYLKFCIKNKSNINIVSDLFNDYYDVIVAQDVLEHLVDPFKAVKEISKSINVGTHVIFANCFYPQIKCHLKRNFHLRHTFKHIIKYLGFTFVGNVDGASHAEIFIFSGKSNNLKFYTLYSLSIVLGPIFNVVYPFWKKIKI